MNLREQAIFTANALENMAAYLERYNQLSPEGAADIMRQHAADLLAAVREEQGNV